MAQDATVVRWRGGRESLAGRPATTAAPVPADLLSGTQLFASLNDEQLDQVASLCGLWRLGKGQTILSAGDIRARVFVVVSGEVTVELEVFYDFHLRPEATAIEKVGPGGVIGCCALVDECRGMTARCATDVETLVVGVRELKALLTARPDIGLVVMENALRIVAGRLLRARQVLLAQFGLRQMYQTYRNY
jgi:CRP-like cAMP-binding protein